jgi:hypothetical protein
MERTSLQNRSLHLFADKLATELNSKGLDMRVVLKPEYRINWDSKSVKENIIKPIAKAMYGVDSTTQLDTGQISKVHEAVMNMLIEKFTEIDYIDFPSQETTEEYYNSFKQ